eukprot:jgi/Psemu1/30465/gm1.30465_g
MSPPSPPSTNDCLPPAIVKIATTVTITTINNDRRATTPTTFLRSRRNLSGSRSIFTNKKPIFHTNTTTVSGLSYPPPTAAPSIDRFQQHPHPCCNHPNRSVTHLDSAMQHPQSCLNALSSYFQRTPPPF